MELTLTTISSSSFKTTKEFKFKEGTNTLKNTRGYYIGKDVADGEYPIVIFNRFAGYGNNQNTMLHDKVSPKIIVKGSRYDDIIEN